MEKEFEFICMVVNECGVGVIISIFGEVLYNYLGFFVYISVVNG